MPCGIVRMMRAWGCQVVNELRVDAEASRAIAGRLEGVAVSITTSVDGIPTQCRGGDVEHLLWGIVGDVTAACAVLHSNAARGSNAVRRIADDAEYADSVFEAEFESLTKGLG